MRIWALLWALASIAAAAEQRRVSAIDFFGYDGLDVHAVRRELPINVGDTAPEDFTAWKQAAREAARRATGKPATNVTMVCCDENGGLAIYIGLAGTTSHAPEFYPAPEADMRLPDELTRLDAEIEEAWSAAVREGSAREDQSTGYALSSEPKLRSLQVRLREVALRHEKRIVEVLAGSRHDEERAIAAMALGYARQSEEQIRMLARAASDPHREVRNNAVRALGVLARGVPAMRAKIPPSVFVDLVRSAYWTDRNKGSFVLLALTEDRDPMLLRELRERAVEELKEMAAWQWSGHANPARTLLERIARLQ